VISLAIIFAFFIRNTDKDKEAAEFIDEDQIEFDNDDEDYLHSIQVCSFQMKFCIIVECDLE
jgi:hypothetical protein